jgi:uncharacterized membrane protein
MKYSDIQKLLEAGLITEDQRHKITEHFQLKEDANRFLTIISFVGAILIASGIILLVASNWDEIPRGVKIAVGLLLMLGAHGGGWYLREVQRKYPKVGEALHLIGSGLFLGNIALIGQIYHLSSRAPNAILLWWLGIAPLPWLLRSKAQHLLVLLAFGLWFGLEANERDSLIFFGNDERQLLLYALLGLIYVGAGYCLRRTRYADFAPATERLGLLGFLLFAYPLTWGMFGRHHGGLEQAVDWVFPALSAVALLAVAAGSTSLTDLTRQWRWTWALSLAGAVGLLAGAMYLAPAWGYTAYDRHSFGYHWIAAIALFVFCLLQIQVGIQERSPSMINLGVVFIALDIIAIYFVLIGSMARTGLMFVISGVFLIAFGVYLEKKRRALMHQIKPS